MPKSTTGDVPGFRALGIRTCQILFYVLLTLILLPFGSVEAVPLHLLAIFFFVLTALSAGLVTPNAGQAWLFRTTLVLMLLLAAWICFQGLQFQGNPLANSVWDTASELLGPLPGAISIVPSSTFQALIPTMLPFAIFLAAMLLFQSDEDSLQLLRVVAISGGVMITLLLLQFFLFPGSLMFTDRIHYGGSFTAMFVNRNTGATYIGFILVLLTGLLFHAVQSVGILDYIRLLMGVKSKAKKQDLWIILAFMGGAGIALIALLLTKSRAGSVSGMAGLALLAIILAFYGGTRKRRSQKSGFASQPEPRFSRAMRVMIVVAILVGLGLLLGGQVLLRAEIQGAEDQRFCFLPGLTQMVKDNWLLGTGLGTFREAFGPYRDPACDIYGILDKAHNVYIEGWAGLGLPFVLFTVAIIAILFTVFRNGLRSRKQYRWVPACGAACLLIVILHSTVDFSVQIPGVAAIFAAVLGACCTISLQRTSSRSDRPKPAV